MRFSRRLNSFRVLHMAIGPIWNHIKCRDYYTNYYMNSQPRDPSQTQTRTLGEHLLLTVDLLGRESTSPAMPFKSLAVRLAVKADRAESFPSRFTGNLGCSEYGFGGGAGI
jgi:hypothetical protein